MPGSTETSILVRKRRVFYLKDTLDELNRSAIQQARYREDVAALTHAHCRRADYPLDSAEGHPLAPADQLALAQVAWRVREIGEELEQTALLFVHTHLARRLRLQCSILIALLDPQEEAIFPAERTKKAAHR